MRQFLMLCSALGLAACAQHDTASYTEAAGKPKSVETHALEAGARLLQGQVMGFTADGQLDPALEKARDERLGVDTQARRRDRESIVQPEVDPAANAWEKGEVIQLQRVRGAGEHRHGDTAGPAEINESGRLRQQQQRSDPH